jgi:hypothetical protein
VGTVVGAVEGSLLGIPENVLLGAGDSMRVGTDVGLCDGRAEGDKLGPTDGI